MSAESIRTTCAYCGVGCGIVASVDHAARTVEIAGDKVHPANYGRLCSKGSALGETLDLDQRALYPLINGARASWDESLSKVANKLHDIIAEHGPDSVMLYVSGQLLTEDYYVANKLVKGFIGTNNIDSNSRLCMSSAVAGYLRAFGSDTVPTCYEDIEQAELFVIAGSNMAWCHPVLFQRLKAAKEADGKKVVVIDPRKTDSCAIADYHLPIKPGTDVALFNGLLSYLSQHGHQDDAYLKYCAGADSTLQAAQEFDSVAKVASFCELSPELVERFYKDFSQTNKTVSFYSMGLNQSSSGTDKVNSLINCHLFSGKLGYEGAGPFSITGQPNAMGGREVGALANLLASHFSLASAADRASVSNFWKTPNPIAAQVGVKPADAASAMKSGRIKAIWIMATNPVVSLPEADEFAKGLEQCELVIVSDCSKQSDTARYADVFFPAQGWSEKSGTVTNSERRISRQRRLLAPAGEAKPDWWILKEIAQRMGFEGFNYEHPCDVFTEHARLSAYNNAGSRSFNIAGLADLSRAEYDALTPQQWPVPKKPSVLLSSSQQNSVGQSANDVNSAKRFFGSGTEQAPHFYHKDNRAHLIPVVAQAPKSKRSKNYPLILNTGRIRDQWHTMTRTGMSPRLNQHYSEPFAFVHPQDLANYDCVDDGLIRIASERGEVIVRAKASSTQRQGEIFAPIHWSDHFAAKARVGALIEANLCPISSQPEFKFTPVAIQAVPTKNRLKLLIANSLRQAVDTELRTLTTSDHAAQWVEARQQNAYEVTIDYHDPSHGVHIHHSSQNSRQNNSNDLSVLATDKKDKAVVQIHEGIIALTDRLTMPIQTESSSSKANKITAKLGPQAIRTAVFNNNTLQSIVLFDEQGKVPATSWLQEQIGQEIEPLARSSILAARPSEGVEDIGKIICACFTVGEKTIQNAISEGCRSAAAIGEKLKAGTNCGSCIPEINEILARSA